MSSNIKYKPRSKTTVREELEYWNVIHLLERLKIYYRNSLRYQVKDLQGLEAHDFAMYVLEKIISEESSWKNSSQISFIDFVYNTAKGHLSHWIRDTKNGTFISYGTGNELSGKRRYIMQNGGYKRMNETMYWQDEFNGY